MKFLIIFFLAIAIFAAGIYFTWRIYIKPRQDLAAETALGPPPEPPDPTIPEFEKCAALQQSGKLLDARAAFAAFVERNPDSSKIDDAKSRLGQINSFIFLSNYPSPEKETYVVQKGDVIMRVAAKMRTSAETIMKANDLRGTMLRIGERITVMPADFSLVIDTKDKDVVVLNAKKFFKQYSFAAAGPATPKPGGKKAPPVKTPKIAAKVVDKIAWANGQRVTIYDKGDAYADADHWIVIAPSGHSLYSDRPGADGKVNKPPGGGYGLSPEDMQELAAMINKNTPVTIE